MTESKTQTLTLRRISCGIDTDGSDLCIDRCYEAQFPENNLTIEQSTFLYKYLPIIASSKDKSFLGHTDVEFSFGDGTMVDQDMDGNEPIFTMEQQFHSSELDLKSFNDNTDLLFTVKATYPEKELIDLGIKHIMDITLSSADLKSRWSVDLVSGGDATKHLIALISEMHK